MLMTVCLKIIVGVVDRFNCIYAWMYGISSASIQDQSLSRQFSSLWYWHFRSKLFQHDGHLQPMHSNVELYNSLYISGADLCFISADVCMTFG